ncbi:DUF2513 domain-containing protein [Chitinimonas sp.]|uniref:DUF2513 domain-containing protein n=1 Tax=Chitinimonas sp. TaxID=1934313 RepID=UPI0035B3C435
MKRDMDLVRNLLLKLEDMPVRPGGVVLLDPAELVLQIDGATQEEIQYHLRLMREARFIDNGGTNPLIGISFRALTWEGHDFLDSVRDPDVWAKTKSGAMAAGGFTMDLLKEIAKGFIKKQLEDRTGIKL